jgi:inner membrane transporter RhtA
VAAAVAAAARPAADRLGRGAGGDELHLLPGHRPVAARDRGGDRVPALIVLAALGARSPRNAAAVALAVGGVACLADVRLAGAPLGFALAAANSALFALYIVLGHRVAQRGAGIDGLAAAMLVALVAVTPLSGWAAAPAFGDPVALAAGLGVGICSSVIPYVCDQLAMARLTRAGYALLVALLPATATLIGVVVLGQIPTAAEVAGVVLVMLGVAVHREPARAAP